MVPLYTTRQETTAPLAWEEAKRIVGALSAHFQVATPKIEWNLRTRRGRYHVERTMLKIGPRVWRGVNTVVHEFAHHLDMVRRGHAGKLMLRPRVQAFLPGGYSFTRIGRRDFHGPSFVRALEECAAATFGDVELYDWAHEYKVVRREHGYREPVRAPFGIGAGWLVMRQGSFQPLPMAASPTRSGQSLDRAAQKRASRLARLARRALVS